MLSELERLAAMVLDPVRVHEIGVDQWPLAMIACGLVTGNDPDRVPDTLKAYELFVQKVAPAARASALNQLVRFITQRKGDSWRAFIPFAIAEPEPLISNSAAMQLALLAQPTPQNKLSGVETLVDMLIALPQANPAALSAILGLSDLRALPFLEKLYTLSQERLSGLILAQPLPGNHLSYQWMLRLLIAHPQLASAVEQALVGMASTASSVLDVVLPIPTWAYESPTPQPLHGWTLPEYYARMLPTLQQHCSPDQLARIRAAFSVA